MAGTDIHMFPGPKRYFETFEEANRAVQKRYPKACWTGSLATWHWRILRDDGGYDVVAEAWEHRIRRGVWLRVAKTPICERSRLMGMI